jgi:phosphoglycolate phosphatase
LRWLDTGAKTWLINPLMTLPKPTIVIFDMDGTTVRHVNPKLLHLLETADDFMFKSHRFWGRLFRRGDKTTIYKVIDDYKARKKPKLIVHRVLHKFRRKPVEQIVQPCPGIYAVLEFLHARGIPMGLVSNGLGKGYGHEILEKFDLVGFFRSTIFREDITHSKPNPESILLSLKSMAAAVTEHDVVWYIGDRHKDIIAARGAQKHAPCKMVPIAYGLNAALGMLEKDAIPDHILMSYYEMYEILSDLFSGERTAAA